MKNKFNFLLVFIIVLISGCASKIPIPVEGEEVTKKEEKCPDVYKVKDGETLFSISLMCGFNYQDVAKANGLAKPYKVRKGDFIRFDLLRQTKPVEIEQPMQNNEVETIPLDQQDFIIEEPGIITPIQIKEPKVIREIYSSKTLKKANKIVATRKQLSDKWISPADGKLISTFDMLNGKKGIEIQGEWGQEIRAVTKGKIIYAGEDLKGYGKLVILKHNDGILTIYGSQNQILVTENQVVNAGQTIGTMGSSATEEIKLIFEVRDGGKSINPLKYLKNYY
jgi:lipoprotein NlpD